LARTIINVLLLTLYLLNFPAVNIFNIGYIKMNIYSLATVKCMFAEISMGLFLWQKLNINEPRHDKTQYNAFATSMDPDQLAHPCSLIRIHAVCLQNLLQVE
jgi:hypothetical protein